MKAFISQRLVGKFAALFAIAGLIVALGSFVALERILHPTFEAIEADSNWDQQARARASLDLFNSAVLNDAADYAVWDDAYQYARRPTAEFEAETLSKLAYQNLALDYVGVIRFDGTAVWSKVRDLATGKILETESRIITEELSRGIFAQKARQHDRFGGYVRGGNGKVYSVHAVWIRKSDGSGEPGAYMVMGKLLSSEVLGEALRVKVSLNPEPDAATEQALLAAKDNIRAIAQGEFIRNEIALIGTAGTVQAVVGFDTPRTVTRTGISAVRSAMAAMGLSLLILAILLALGVNWIAVARLQALRSHVASFRTGRRVIEPRLLASDDEIGTLAKQFDRLTDELAEAEDELRRSSYVQGKADSAVGLLHNVRNALVPLQTKYEKWEQEDRQPLRRQLVQALDELDGDACPADRRAALEGFAKTAARKLAELGTARSGEIVDIKHSVDQIMAILGDYDFDSSAKPTVQPVDFEALLRREAASLEQATGQPVALILPDAIPSVMANHIHLQQIVANVMVNAGEAMAAREPDDWTLTVATRIDEAAGTIDIAISDNGEGADPTVLAHAFERGFSTRKDKSGGMGLHWSSNAMRAMSGELVLESQGRGHGATVRLRLPLAPQNVTAIAA